MAKHILGTSPSGLLIASYDDEAEVILLTAPSAKMWRFVLDGEGTLAQLSELLDAWLDKANRQDIRWIVDTLQSVETWLDTCPHDLAKFGEVGVSY